MIGYASFGTNDIDRAVKFYDALLGSLGAKQVMNFGRFIAWGTAPGAPMVCVCKPFNDQPATVGNGSMIALAMPSKDAVDALYAKAIELGGTDEGPPGFRGQGEYFYAGYFRDLDGNKLNAFWVAPRG